MRRGVGEEAVGDSDREDRIGSESSCGDDVPGSDGAGVESMSTSISSV